jgi:hypothetical protein
LDFLLQIKGNNRKEKIHSSAGKEGTSNAEDKVFKYSLFRQNPDVPQLKQDNIVPINEPLFSGKTFQSFDLHAHMVRKHW